MKQVELGFGAMASMKEELGMSDRPCWAAVARIVALSDYLAVPVRGFA